MGDATVEPIRAINRAQFGAAKRFWAASFLLKVALFGVGLWSALGPGWSGAPLVMLAMALTAEALQLRSDVVRARAEAVLRLLDRCQSFGEPIPAAEVRELHMEAPRARGELAARYQLADEYFSAGTAPGPAKAVANLLESAWYTRHQASRMALLYYGVVAVLVALSVFALLAVIRFEASTDAREWAVKLVTSTLALLVSLSLVKSGIAYSRLATRCERTEQACERLLAGTPTDAEALRQWSEYQLGRATAPLIPDWLWSAMRLRLDEAWRARLAA